MKSLAKTLRSCEESADKDSKAVPVGLWLTPDGFHYLAGFHFFFVFLYFYFLLTFVNVHQIEVRGSVPKSFNK